MVRLQMYGIWDGDGEGADIIHISGDGMRGDGDVGSTELMTILTAV